MGRPKSPRREGARIWAHTSLEGRGRRLKIVVHGKGRRDFMTAEFADGIEGTAGGTGPFFRDKVLDPRQESQNRGGGLVAHGSIDV